MSGPLVRLWEKVFRIPHRHEEASRVSAAAEELTSTARALNARLKPYVESDDPLVALMTDVFNRRSMGSDNGKAEHYP
jgi:hypothetical protein